MMKRSDADALLDEIRENIGKKERCTMHRFDAPNTYTIGTRLPCKHCGAWFRLPEITLYAQGFAHAGGRRDDILPGLEKMTPHDPA